MQSSSINIQQSARNQVSFSSNIRLTTSTLFGKEIERYGAKETVQSPWTVSEMVFGDKAYTTDIYDCIAGGFTDGKKVLMFHICPHYPNRGIDTYKRNENFAEIGQSILNHFGNKTEGLRALVLGGKTKFKESNKVFENFKNFMNENNIDYSSINGVKSDIMSSVAYDVKKDTWTITNDCIAQQLKKGSNMLRHILEKCFQNIKISPNDKLIKN